jgi:hypothetical protein
MYYSTEFGKLFLLSRSVDAHAVTNLLGPLHWLEATFYVGVGTMLFS